MIVAVSDTGPLIHLDAVDALDTLSVVDDLLIPETVYDELAAGDVPKSLSDVEHEIVESSDRPEGVARLDAGETESLAVAIDRNAVLLTDDLDARDAANDAGVEVHGSLGVVALAYARGPVAKHDAVDLMRDLQTETSLFVTDTVVERGIALLEES